jgi:ferric hydroxamate transport system substrate-binding protein
MTTTRSLAAALAGAALLLGGLTACGTTQTGAAAADAPAASGSAGCDAVGAASTGPVSLTDAIGRTVKLDRPAQRVAVLEWQQTEDVLSLCTTPVAVADVAGFGTWDTAETLPKGVKDIGTRGEPNLDTLFATDPDLVIVEAASGQDDVLTQLEKYEVPVLVTSGADAKDPVGQLFSTVDLIAKALGREDRAKDLRAEFDDAVAAATAKVDGAELATRDYVYFDGWIDGGNVSIRPFGTGSLIGALGEEVGLHNAWTGETDPAYGLGQTDLEGLTAVGSATLLHTSTSDADSDIMPELAKSPVWSSLPAVQDGRVHGFPTGIWTFGGPRSAIQIIDAYVDVITR